MGKNLLELKSLDVSEIVSILDQAQAFHDGEVFRGPGRSHCRQFVF